MTFPLRFIFRKNVSLHKFDSSRSSHSNQISTPTSLPPSLHLFATSHERGSGHNRSRPSTFASNLPKRILRNRMHVGRTLLSRLLLRRGRKHPGQRVLLRNIVALFIPLVLLRTKVQPSLFELLGTVRVGLFLVHFLFNFPRPQDFLFVSTRQVCIAAHHVGQLLFVHLAIFRHWIPHRESCQVSAVWSIFVLLHKRVSFRRSFAAASRRSLAGGEHRL